MHLRVNVAIAYRTRSAPPDPIPLEFIGPASTPCREASERTATVPANQPVAPPSRTPLAEWNPVVPPTPGRQ